MTEHAYDVKINVVEPTCCTTGYTTYGCSAGECNTTKDLDETPFVDHVYDVKGETIAPTCSAEGYTVYGCSAGECNTTDNKEFERRVAHTFVDVNEFDEIICTECAQRYINTTTVVNTGSGTLCLGCESTEGCTCNVDVMWKGYVAPQAPETLEADEAKTIGGDNVPAEIVGGLIKITSAEESSFEIYVNEEKFEFTGTEFIVDLYSFESVEQIVVYSSTAAEFVFYKNITAE